MRHSIIYLGIFILLSCSEKKETILFSSGRNGNSDIYLMDSDGGNIRQLTSLESEEWGPTWITENVISFLRQQGDSISRYSLNILTKEEIQLGHPTNCILDDKNILYAKNLPLQLYECDGNIFLFNSETTRTTNLTENLDGVSAYPSWTEDFQKIIFTNNQDGNNNIYMMDISSKVISTLITFPSNDERAELSPDGRLLVFSSNRDNSNNQDIFIKDLETGSVENLTKSEGNELIARWSQDGNTIYFGSNTDGNWEIYSFSLGTRETKRLTDDASFDGDPRIY